MTDGFHQDVPSVADSYAILRGLAANGITIEPTHRNVSSILFTVLRLSMAFQEDRVELFRTLQALHPSGTPEYRARTILLTAALEDRFDSIGNMEDLLELVTLQQQLVGCPPCGFNHHSTMNGPLHLNPPPENSRLGQVSSSIGGLSRKSRNDDFVSLRA